MHELDMKIMNEHKKDISNILSRLDSIGESTSTTPSRKTTGKFSDECKQEITGVMTGLNKLFEKINIESDNDPELRRALVTEKTDTGVVISEWKISENNKRYEISHRDQVIINEIRHYNSALAIINILESGRKINDKDVLDILMLENKYCSVYDEAVLYKSYLRKNLSSFKRNLYEDRFSEAKNQLKSIKEKISMLT